MKYICIFLLLILTSIFTYSQETAAPRRNVSLVVLDKKGRPVNNIIVRSLSSTRAGMTDRNGVYVFTDMTDDDKISVMLPKYGEASVPVAGMDSIVVTLRSARRFTYMNKEEQSVIIDKKNKTEAYSLIDVPALLKQHPYTTLVELLQGANVPGLNISSSGMRAGGNTSANIRGERSLLGSSEPLVVVDGLPMGGLNDANQTLNVNDIVTIEVQKSSSEWGVRGANGVILVNTK